jgi:hypothetical protein
MGRSRSRSRSRSKERGRGGSDRGRGGSDRDSGAKPMSLLVRNLGHALRCFNRMPDPMPCIGIFRAYRHAHRIILHHSPSCLQAGSCSKGV